MKKNRWNIWKCLKYFWLTKAYTKYQVFSYLENRTRRWLPFHIEIPAWYIEFCITIHLYIRIVVGRVLFYAILTSLCRWLRCRTIRASLQQREVLLCHFIRYKLSIRQQSLHLALTLPCNIVMKFNAPPRKNVCVYLTERYIKQQAIS